MTSLPAVSKKRAQPLGNDFSFAAFTATRECVLNILTAELAK